MLTFICLFFPAVLYVWMFEGLTKEELSFKKWVHRYAFGVVFINLLCWLIQRFVLDNAYTPFYDANYGITPAAACDYMVMALIFTAVLGAFAALLHKKGKIAVEDQEDAPK